MNRTTLLVHTMFLFRSLVLPFSVFLSSSISAASLTDSILEIPQGTVFELRYELEIPANRDYIVLGNNHLNETINTLDQTFNEQENIHNRFHHHHLYLSAWQNSADASYRECLERHRVYYHDHPQSSDNVIINKGQGNTNVIINNSSAEPARYGSYIAHNHCIKPEHTIAVLLLDTDEAGAGIFRDGYSFEVSTVTHQFHNGFHTVTIWFDHDIARGIRIITTESPENIQMHQLQYHESGEGFWNGLASGLAGLTAITGEHFTIHLPGSRYYD